MENRDLDRIPQMSVPRFQLAALVDFICSHGQMPALDALNTVAEALREEGYPLPSELFGNGDE